MAARCAVFSCVGEEVGWGPIRHLTELAARCLGARHHVVPTRWTDRLRTRLSGAGAADVALAFSAGPGQLRAILRDPRFGRGRALRIAWIVDSFWTERVPKGALERFDLVVYMQGYDRGFYETACRGRCLYLPWGTDALALGSDRAGRAVDLMRVGRQPGAWDDDARSAAAAARHGLVFAGRPPRTLSHRDLMGVYATARYVLAFSNLAAGAPYTHPAKAYYTGRWLDALACGASVAGIPPAGDAGLHAMLWPEALVTFDAIDPEDNLRVLARARAGWTGRRARLNHAGALRHLDWRWRLAELARTLGIRPPALAAELAALEGRLAARAGP